MALGHNSGDIDFFSGDAKNDRDILLHAINYLQNKSSGDYVGRIFKNITDNRKRNYIEAIMTTSNLFNFDSSKTFKPFRLSDETLIRVTQIGVEKFLDEKEIKTDASNYKDLPLERLAEKPITQPNPTPNNHSPMNAIMRLVIIISKHPLWSAVIAGIILLLISHFIFGTP